MAPSTADETQEAGPTATTSTDVTRNVSPMQTDSMTPPGWLHSSRPADTKQSVTDTSSAISLAGLTLTKFFRRKAARSSAGWQQKEVQSVPADFPALQPDSPRLLSVAHPAAEPASAITVTATADSKPVEVVAASISGPSRWPFLRSTSAHTARQEPDTAPEELPSPMAVENRLQTPQSPLFAALKKHVGPDANMPAPKISLPRVFGTGVRGLQQQSDVQEGDSETVLMASGCASAAAVEAAAAAPKATAATASEAVAPEVPSDVPNSTIGFTLGGFRLSRPAQRKTVSKQRPMALQLFQATTEVKVPAAAPEPYSTTEVQDLHVSAQAAQSAAPSTAESDTSAALPDQQQDCIAAAEGADEDPAPTSPAPSVGGTTRLFHSFKHIRLRPRRVTSDRQESSAQNHQQQQQLIPGVPSDESTAEGLRVNSTSATNTAPALVVATAAEEATIAVEEDSSEASADATAVGTATGSSTAAAPEIEPATDTTAAHELQSQPPALVVESSANCLPQPGPLRLNRTALSRSSQGTTLPLAGHQRSKALAAWSQLPNEVSKMSYASTAPLEPKPLPPPKHQGHKPTAAWAELPGQGSDLSYGAPSETAPLATAMEAWADMPAEASRILLPGQPLSPAVQRPQHLQHPQQREVPGAQGVPVQSRVVSESGFKPQVPNLPQQMSAGMAGPGLKGPLQAGASSTWHASAITAGLPPSAQQLHEQVISRLRLHGPSHITAATPAAGGVWSNVPAGLGSGPNSSQQTIAQLVKELSSSSTNTSCAGPLSSHMSIMHVPASAPLTNNSTQQQQRSNAVPAAAMPGAAPGAPASLKAQSSGTSGPLGATWGSQASARSAQQVATPPLSAESSQITALAHTGSVGVRHLSNIAAAGPGSRQKASSMRTNSASTAPAQPVGGTAYSSILPAEQSSAAVSHCTTASRSSLVGDDSRPTIGYDAGAHRGLAVTTLGGILTPSSTAGSVVTDVSSAAARYGSSGCRAADVRSIVHRAKERAAARQRLPTPLSPPQEQQEEEEPAAELAEQQAITSPFSAKVVQQQQLAAAWGQGSSALPPVPRESRSNCSAGSSFTPAVAAAAAAEDGERTVRMLQDYRIISELDRQIKARVNQLSSPRQSIAGAVAQAAAGTVTSDSCAGNATALDCGSSLGYAGQGDMDTSAAQQQQQHQGRRTSGTVSVDLAAPPAARWTAHSGCSQQQQQQQAKWLHNDRYEQPGSSAAHSSTASGLLGIREALDNSFDAGKPSRAKTAANAAPTRMATAVGFGSSSSVPANSRTTSGRYNSNRNPFLSPNSSPEPAANTALDASYDKGVEDSQQHDDNPFLRESLVLQPLPPVAAVREKQQQQQQWHGVAGGRDDCASNSSSCAISQHIGLSQAVFDNIAATWMSGRSVAAATAPSFSGTSSSTYNAAGPDVGICGRSDYSRAPCASSKGSRTRNAKEMNGQYSGTLPGAALAGQSMANAAAAARTVDER